MADVRASLLARLRENGVNAMYRHEILLSFFLVGVFSYSPKNRILLLYWDFLCYIRVFFVKFGLKGCAPKMYFENAFWRINDLFT